MHRTQFDMVIRYHQPEEYLESSFDVRATSDSEDQIELIGRFLLDEPLQSYQPEQKIPRDAYVIKLIWHPKNNIMHTISSDSSGEPIHPKLRNNILALVLGHLEESTY
ncbi:hypothetical protein CMI42_04180 [Candidatus Pacearchaeota archaeon]|nr:hypothetical protein [Candidatus Pacearchaeota archaeon]|tara:strand:- start:1902 stop:2225 length:324 start_codon:yes stop_codon:yes gene_type:complete